MQNRLTAVMVNRIWQNHFGRGLPADTSASGASPTHPELDIWRGSFMADGWSASHSADGVVADLSAKRARRRRAILADPATNCFQLSTAAPDAESIRDGYGADGALTALLFPIRFQEPTGTPALAVQRGHIPAAACT
jgi:hypothetical protein